MNVISLHPVRQSIACRIGFARAAGAAIVLVAAMAICGCAVSPATPVSVADESLRRADSSWLVAARIDPETVRISEVVRVRVSSARSGYLYLFQVSTDGKALTLVFPNTVDAANAITQGGIELPNPNWQLRANGPAGTGYMLATVTAGLQDINAINAAVAGGQMPKFNGPYGAAMVTYKEVAQ